MRAYGAQIIVLQQLVLKETRLNLELCWQSPAVTRLRCHEPGGKENNPTLQSLAFNFLTSQVNYHSTFVTNQNGDKWYWSTPNVLQ